MGFVLAHLLVLLLISKLTEIYDKKCFSLQDTMTNIASLIVINLEKKCYFVYIYTLVPRGDNNSG